MQARRAAALVVTCILGLCLLTAAHFDHAAKHPVRGVVAVAAGTADTPQHLRQAPDDSVPAGSDATGRPRLVARTTDTSQGASARTAQTPLIRGPPDQGRN